MAETRFALVTGANRGIGLEIVRQLSRLGIVAVIGSRDIDKGRTAAESLKSEGFDIPVVQLDVTDAASVTRGVADATAYFGRIDILINNAGLRLDRDTPILEVPDEVVAATLNANTIGALRVTQALAPGMITRNFGRIVNISSIMGQLKDMGGGSPSYRMSKVALNAMTRILAAEIGHANVKINAASPGWVKTDMGGPDAALSVAEGADTAVWLATLEEDGPTGGFFEGRKPIAW